MCAKERKVKLVVFLMPYFTVCWLESATLSCFEKWIALQDEVAMFMQLLQ
jgi:hypothetical protein